MDCCKTKKSSVSKEMKGGNRKMNLRIVLWVVIGVLFIIAVVLTFKTGVVGSVPIETASTTAKAAASYGGMVGGC